MAPWGDGDYSGDMGHAAPWRRARARAVPATAAAILLSSAYAFARARRDPLDAATRRGLDEAARAVLAGAPAAARAWPGYEPLSQPLLIAFADGALAIGAARPPRGFRREPGFRSSVYASGRARASDLSYSGDERVDGAAFTAVRLRPGGAAETAAFFLHERFHERQFAVFRRLDLRSYAVEEPEDAALAGLENARLADWLEDGGEEPLRDFAALRRRRRRLFPGTEAEEAGERVEGAATFVEWAAREASSGAASARGLLLRELRAPVSAAAMPRRRAYATGAALCRWLDGAGVLAWRARVEAGESPSALALERLAVGPDEEDRRVSRLARAPAFAAAVETARREIAGLRAARGERLRRYGSLPGRRLVLEGDAAAAAFSGDWLDYPDGRSLMTVGEWTVRGPRVRARLSGGQDVLRRGDSAEFVVPPGAVVTLDGARWTFRPGRAAFRSLVISAPPSIALAAGPGALDDDGERVRLLLDGPP